MYKQKEVSVDTDFINKTIEVWKQGYNGSINKEDAREIYQNITGFFDVLKKYDTVKNEET